MKDLESFPRDAESGRSDHSLLKLIKTGDQDAATALYLRYAERLNALARSKSSRELAYKIEAEEIVQSVFGSFFRGAQNGFYKIPVGEELWKLFLVIALNKIRAKGAFFHAAKRDSRLTQGSDVLEEQENHSSGQDQISLKVLEMSIDEEMLNLPPHYRQMIELRVAGYEIQEIATLTKRSKRTVERILQETRQKLSSITTANAE